MNWRILLLLTALCSATAGCRRPGKTPWSFAKDDTPQVFGAQILAVPCPPISPASYAAEAAEISGGADLAREPQPSGPLTLQQCQCLALQNSQIVRTLSGDSVGLQTATQFDPVIAEQDVRAALAAFDTSFGAGFNWNRFEGPPNSFFGPGIDRAARRDEATLAGGFTKKWLTGAQTRVAYNPSPGYLFFPNGGTGFNPSHVAALEIGARQPLLRGAGREVNQAPIVIAQLNVEQSSWDVKQALLAQARSVEQAYWELTAARISLKSVSEQLPLIDEVVRLQKANREAKRAVAADVAKASSLQHEIRQQVGDAQLVVREKELRLMNLTGVACLPAAGVLPVTPPMSAPVIVDFPAVVAAAVDHRPAIVQQRIRTRIRETELAVAKNHLKPQFDLSVLYRANGLEDNLEDALRMMMRQDFTDWEFGAVYSSPIGRRADKAALRAAELQLQREKALLLADIRATSYALNEIVVRVSSFYEQYREATLRSEDAKKWLDGARTRFNNPPPSDGDSNWRLVALNDLIFALQQATAAAQDAGRLLADYNIELARLQETQGISLAACGIYLMNDACIPRITEKLPLVDLRPYVATTGDDGEKAGAGSAPLPLREDSEVVDAQYCGEELRTLPSVEDVPGGE